LAGYVPASTPVGYLALTRAGLPSELSVKKSYATEGPVTTPRERRERSFGISRLRIAPGLPAFTNLNTSSEFSDGVRGARLRPSGTVPRMLAVSESICARVDDPPSAIGHLWRACDKYPSAFEDL
jgi:hypothetical protein